MCNISFPTWPGKSIRYTFCRDMDPNIFHRHFGLDAGRTNIQEVLSFNYDDNYYLQNINLHHFIVTEKIGTTQ